MNIVSHAVCTGNHAQYKYESTTMWHAHAMRRHRGALAFGRGLDTLREDKHPGCSTELCASECHTYRAVQSPSVAETEDDSMLRRVLISKSQL